MDEARGYRPIADYAALGDCHGCALVAKDGSVDWCCFERFDADPLFCRILDAGRGGYLSIRPHGAFESARAYVPRTNILRTEFATAGGRFAVTDFMPLGRRPGAAPNDYVSVIAPGWLARRIEVLQGEVEIEVACKASIDFARQASALSRDGRDVTIDGARRALRTDIALQVEGDLARGVARLAAGDRRFVVVAPAADRVDDGIVDALFEITRAYWSEWLGYCRYSGAYAERVERSALALKLLTYPASGACVAACTTSLPEKVGGERNWDYRYCWIRDTSLALHALSALGYSEESHLFWDFVCRALAKGVEHLQVMYGIGGEPELPERIVEHLEGYRASRPVRVGNAACVQSQIDLYGYVLEAAFVYHRLGAPITRGDREVLARIADFIEDRWLRPDTGIWESRGPLRHFVHSKAMCWIVMDRAIKLLGARERWVALRERIWDEIWRKGRDPANGHFVQAIGENDPRAVDAALLQLAVLGLPVDDATMRKTRLAVERELGRGDFLERYRTSDGVAGGEGAFLVCSFWHVDALLAEGEQDAAKGLFERLLACANDVGLYSEEIDPQSRAFLGNFPQAFTHLGLVNSAVSLALCERYGPAVVRTGYAERAHRSVKATFGWRGVLAAFLATRRIRVLSSRASRLPPELVRGA